MVRHRKMKKLALISLAALALSGCYSHLHVKLSVMDQEKVQELVTKWQHQPLVIAARAGDTSMPDQAVAEICQAYTGAYIRAYTAEIAATKAALKAAESAAKPALYKEEREEVELVLEIQEAELKRLTGSPVTKGCVKNGNTGFIDLQLLHRDFLAIGRPAETPDELKRRNESVLRYRGRLDAARLDAQLELQALDIADSEASGLLAKLPVSKTVQTAQKVAEDAASESKNAVDQANAKLDHAVTVTGYLGNGGRTLARSELASDVVRLFNEEEDAHFYGVPLEKKVWAKEYNVASGKGFGGSTDMVMKLTNDADFSVKGVTFDARSTASAVRKVTMSSIQILASGAGLPMTVPAPTKDEPNKTEVIPTTEITAARSKVTAAETADKNYRISLRALASSMLTAGQEVDSNKAMPAATRDPANAQARVRAKATFDALRPALAAPQAK
jgi:hypothetical protein